MLLQQAIDLINNPFIHQEQPVIWADFGCGKGMFTQAMASLLADGSKIYAADKYYDAAITVPANKKIALEFQEADFETEELTLSGLDGILMANSLHYISDKRSLLRKLGPYMNAHGAFLIVEYDTLNANRWVPYPINISQLKKLFTEAGYAQITELGRRPSLYGQGDIYACYFAPN